MLIRKINSGLMKHSRWLFGVFTVVIIVSFVGFLTPTSSVFGLFNRNGADSVGTVYGENVGVETIQEHAKKLNTMMQLVNPYLAQDLPVEVVFQNYAMMRYAEKHGIVATDSDVASAIRHLPAFQKNGKFDRASYDGTLKALYKNRGITGEDVSEALRLFIIGNKVRENLFSNLVGSDNEVRAFYELNNQRFDYRKMNFKAADFKKLVKVGGEDLKKFLIENPDRYVMPAQFDALVVEFPYAAYEAEAVKLAKPGDARAYYEEHPEDFLKKAAEPGKPADVAPFEQVAAKAGKLALEASARNLAARAAQKFAKDIYEQVESSDAGDKVKLFEAVLKQRKLSAGATGFFDSESGKAGKYDEPALAEQIFGAGSVGSVTNAVYGKKAALVGFITGVREARAKTVDECARELKEDFVASESFKMAEKTAAEFFAAVSNAPAQERAKLFAAAAAGAKLETVKDMILPFDECAGDPEKSAVRELKVGGCSAPIAFPDGVTVIFLEKIAPADGKDFEKNPMVWKSKCLLDKLEKAESAMNRELVDNIKFNSRYAR